VVQVREVIIVHWRCMFSVVSMVFMVHLMSGFMVVLLCMVVFVMVVRGLVAIIMMHIISPGEACCCYYESAGSHGDDQKFLDIFHYLFPFKIVLQDRITVPNIQLRSTPYISDFYQ
jgi:hypothetical protein